MIIHETEQQFIDISNIQFSGRVLDIGGGGEGIISRRAGDKVVAIDTRKEELEETPDIGLKIIMDACELKFLDQSFENITCFFTLMYMGENEIKTFLKEANRVLKHNGKLWIWDITISPKADADAFVAQLKVKISDELTVTTGYGVGWKRSQSCESIRKLCEDEGFILEDNDDFDKSFSLHMRKR